MKKQQSSNSISSRSLTIILTLAMAVILSGLFILLASQNNILPRAPMMISESQPERLIYVSDDKQLISYDPESRVGELILEGVRSFEYSPDGRIAFTREKDNRSTDLYVYDPAIPEIEPFLIMENLEQDTSIWSLHYPFGWSPDGQYLVFATESDIEFGMIIYIWDGETIRNILPDDEFSSDNHQWYQKFLWSPDGQYLAFRTHFGTEEASAIHVWDGDTTVNIMPNDELLRAEYMNMSWNPDGKLAFSLSHSPVDKAMFGIYVWNGETTITITPNDKFVTSLGYGNLDWSPDGQYLAYISTQQEDGKLLYVWDGEMTNHVTFDNQPIRADGFSTQWNYDGRLAFTIYYDELSNIEQTHSIDVYVWDDGTTTRLSSTANVNLYPINWNNKGQLSFTSKDEDNHQVLVWDGVSDSKPIVVADGFLPEATQWRDDGTLAVVLSTYPYQEDGEKFLRIWNMDSKSVIEEIPVVNEHRTRFGATDHIIFSSTLASGLPSIYLDIQDIKRDVIFSTHSGDYSWSDNGYLAYCSWGSEDRDRGWVLNIWDGYENWEVTEISHRIMRWQSNEQIIFCNNG